MFLFENDFRASTKTIRGVRYITVSFYSGDKDIFQKVGVSFQKDREMVTGGDLFMKKGGKIRKTP